MTRVDQSVKSIWLGRGITGRSVAVWKRMYRIYLSISVQTWVLSWSQRHMIVLINLPLWARGTAARALVAALSKQNNATLSFPTESSITKVPQQQG